MTMQAQTMDFAIRLTGGPSNDWLWSVLDETGAAVSTGAAGRQEQARREAEIVAGSLNAFRRVTRGGW
jgi:hypothetical protein